jgi:two-component system, NarL family, nitrate/nitrite response regulator NarL
MQSTNGAGGDFIRVLVADDTRIHTQLLAEALRRDSNLEVINPPARLRDFVDTVKLHKVDVLVLSSNLDEEPMRGFELLRQLRAADPEVLAIMLLDSSKRETVLQAFRAGARGIFSRNESLETLSKCIRSVREGQIWANSEQMTFAVEALATSPTLRAVDANGLSLLSKREMDVVRSLAEGLTNREIADRLGLSQHTVKNYLFRVYDKLGVSSRLELLFMTLTQAGAPLLKGSPAPIYSPARHETRSPVRSGDETVVGSHAISDEETGVSIPDMGAGKRKRKNVVAEDYNQKSDQNKLKTGTAFAGADPLS